MKYVHDDVYNHQCWVVDKDKLTYQTLYFNTIPKQPGDKDDKEYIKWVAQIKDTIAEEVKKKQNSYLTVQTSRQTISCPNHSSVMGWS